MRQVDHGSPQFFGEIPEIGDGVGGVERRIGCTLEGVEVAPYLIGVAHLQELVVLVRADSAGGIPHLDSLRVAIDSASGDVRRYSARANVALGEGAVDEVYRSHVLPATHDVIMIASVNGGPTAATQSATVAVTTGSTTYVEFTLRGTQWTESTWTKSSAAQ